MTDAIRQTLNQLKQAGIVAVLPGDLPLQAVVEIGDALLAAPILAVEVGYNGRHTPTIISDLRQRAQQNMLVGAGGITTNEQVDAAVQAGAQFITSMSFTPELLRHCQAQQIAFVPGVISIFAAQAAFAAGCSMVRLTTGGPGGPDYVKMLCTAVTELDVIVAGEITVAEVAQYQQAGAALMMPQHTLFQDTRQTMADIITRARQLQRAWRERS